MEIVIALYPQVIETLWVLVTLVVSVALAGTIIRTRYGKQRK